jgi:glycosyltransferase involved in cell wall biosynthesis
MKILLVVPDYPPFNQGGGGAVYKAIAEKLAERGHDVTVVAGCPYKKLKKEIVYVNDAGRKIILISLPIVRLLPDRYPKFQSYLPPTLKSIQYLRSLNYDDYEIIHLLAFGHLLIDFINLTINSKKKKILTMHGFPKYVEKEGRANYLTKVFFKIYLKTLGKHTLNSAKIITAVTPFVANDSISKGVDPSKVKIILNGIDLKRYNTVLCYNELEKKYGITKEDVLLLSIGRIVWIKGFEYAIDSIPKVMKTTKRSIKYMVIGSIEDQTYFTNLKRKIKKFGLEKNIIFTGYVDENTKLTALSRADIFLAPSIHETFGIMSLEAMAMDKPIVASNVGGIANILDNMNTAILFTPTRSEEISDAITKLLFHPQLAKKLSNNARHEVKKYDWDSIIDSYEEIYTGLRNSRHKK